MNWSALACLGLYKVFTEWEAQGAALEHLMGGARPALPPPGQPQAVGAQ